MVLNGTRAEYHCSHCQQVFFKVKEVLSHRKMHSSSPYIVITKSKPMFTKHKTEIENINRNTEHDTTVSFTCLCSRVFLKKEEYQLHYKNCELIKCHFCGDIFNKCDMYLHMFFKHKDMRIFNCYLCGYVAATALKYVNHLNVQHVNVVFENDDENTKQTDTTKRIRLFYDDSEAMEEFKQPLVTKIKCQLCKYVVSSQANYREHLIRFHGKGKASESIHDCQNKEIEDLIKCNDEEKSLENKNSALTENLPSSVEAEEAPNDSTTTNELHVQDSSDADDVSDISDETYSECTSSSEDNFMVNTIQNDMLTKRRRRPCKSYCRSCRNTFKSEEEFDSHLKECQIRRKDRWKQKRVPHICDICGHLYSSLQGVLRHIHEMHEGSRQFFICHKCGNQFAKLSRLKVHVAAVHEKQRPFQCHICNKKFQDKTHLQRHIMWHTGQKPFKCELCNKQCIQKCNLRRHRCRPPT